MTFTLRSIAGDGFTRVLVVQDPCSIPNLDNLGINDRIDGVLFGSGVLNAQVITARPGQHCQ